MRPIVEELSPVPDVAAALRTVAHRPGVVLLESCLQREPLGRYSFLAADPCETVQIPRANFGDDPFARLRELGRAFTAETVDGLPPFQGGLAGVLSYELGHAWEQWPFSAHDEFQLPALTVGVYNWVLAWDHTEHRAWLIAHGFPETHPTRQRDRASSRLSRVKKLFDNVQPKSHASDAASRGADSHPKSPLPVSRLTPQFPVFEDTALSSDFSRDGYLRAVERVIEFIHAGDIFQANLSQRLLYPQRQSPLALYEQLRQRNPAPFAGYAAFDDWAVLSASPERFLRVCGDDVETRPIKGTRKRQQGPEADLFTRDELRESRKDQAENVMIVDLLRNDLSRVCAPGSIRVPELCAVETYETVQHLVSEIRGQLEPPHNVWDLLRACFPGGSITGAPKVRAMEIISELEPTARGPYCGSLFYAGFDGNADSNILIRTFICRKGWVQCPVGGGIVGQSNPVAEYEETLHKAEGMLRALR